MRFVRSPELLIKLPPGVADEAQRMASSPYIPRSDDAFLAYAVAFARQVCANPQLYMIAPSDVAFIERHVNAFRAAYDAAKNPETRTKGAILEKDQCRMSVDQLLRGYAQTIKLNAGISDQLKIDLGVRPQHTMRQSRECPKNEPWLAFLGSTPGVDHLRFAAAAGSGSRAKPYGAARLELWRAYTLPGEALPKVSEAALVGSFTKSKMLVNQDLAQIEQGKRPTYYARWAGFSDNKGPNVSAWSPPCSMASAARAASEAAHADERASTAAKLAA